jgi:hypothetical protein
MLISADYISSREFLSYTALLAQQQILYHIVVDKYYTAYTANL